MESFVRIIMRCFYLSVVRALACAGIILGFSLIAMAQTDLAVTVRHAPDLNRNGLIEGSLQQLLGESVTLNDGFVMTGDLLVAGTPTLLLNGTPAFSGVIEGTGSQSPESYPVTLNGSCSLSYVRTRTAPVPLPAVPPPPQPAGSRNITIDSTGQSYGDPAELRDLTLNGNVGQVAVPPGTYGNFIASGGSGFIFGVAGATEPAIYNLQNLILNGNSRLDIVGPVILTVANGFAASGLLGAVDRSSWLDLRIATGGLTLNGGCTVYANVLAPNGTVIVNPDGCLIGKCQTDRFILNSGGCVRAGGNPNQPPVADAQNLSLPENTPFNLTLTGSDPEGVALTFTVLSQPAHGTLSGTAPELTYSPAPDYDGPDSLIFKVNDGVADSAPATISLTVTPAAAPNPANPSFILDYEGLGVVAGAPIPEPYPGIAAATVTHFGRSQNGTVFEDVFFWGNGFGDLVNVASGPPGAPSSSGLADPAWAVINITPNYPGNFVRIVSFDIASLDDNVGGDETISYIVVRDPAATFVPYVNAGPTIAGDVVSTTHTHIDFSGIPIDGPLDTPLQIWWESLGGRVAVDNVRFEIVGPVPGINASDDFYTVAPGGTLTVQPAGVLSNDSQGGNPGPLTASLDTGPTRGTLNLSGNGGFVYTSSGTVGMDGFTYKAVGAAPDSDTGTALISVLPPGALFYDDFARPSGMPLTPWVVARFNGVALGPWTITNGMMKGTSPLVSVGYAYVSSNWTNYSVEARAAMPTNGYGWTVGGRLNPATGAQYGAFVLPYGGGGAWVLRLVKFTGWDQWSGSVLEYQPDVPVPGAGTTNLHALRMTFQGNRILVHWDGELKMDLTDNNFEGPVYSSGGIAIGMYTSNTPYTLTVEDVIVKEVNTP